MRTTRLSPLAAVLLLLAASAPRFVFGQASPYRGLWAGSATLNAVSEVSVSLDADNNPVAPAADFAPQPTFDHAHLRLLLHVNGAGQVTLLKDVAILNRAEPGTTLEGDLALVTDPRVYAEFPPQPAVRLASATFDFGDAKATEAMDALVAEAARLAAAFVMDPELAVGTQGERAQASMDAEAAIAPALRDLTAHADVAESYGEFLAALNVAPDYLLDAIAQDPASEAVSNLWAQATALRAQSFYDDSRAQELVTAVVAAVQAADPEARTAAAHNMAAAFADVANDAQRFISGRSFSTMISAAAAQAAESAKVAGATEATILAALRLTPESVAARTEALQVKIQKFSDTRAEDAVDAVLAAMAAAAFAIADQSRAAIRMASEQAGQAELSDRVARYPLPPLTPTLDYNAFAQSAAFAAAADQAALAAAQAAVEKRATDALYTEASLRAEAALAAANALDALYRTAARAMRTELPLTGVFGDGAEPSDALTGWIYLPARHPTNPFRHRRHPDHTVGFDIERRLRFEFDGPPEGAGAGAGLGVVRVAGTYREEIFGLHKPLGPDPDTDPIGLKVEGRFELHRISMIDTLNIR